MERQTKHQVLPTEDLIRLAKEKIEKLLRTHNLEENVNLVYDLIRECRISSDEDIDICVQKVISNFEETEQEEQQKEEVKANKNDVYSKK